jgi:nicotinamide-nucleotide amidase
VSADPAVIAARARGVIEAYAKAGLTVATAESCTGGMIAAALTDIAGSSAVLDRGYVTYSNAAKVEMISVDAATLAEHGAVSEPVAREMAEGARRASGTSVAISVTGIAGPGGGSAEKPVGLVHFACASPAATRHRECRFGPLDRADIRSASVGVALDMLLDALADQPAL